MTPEVATRLKEITVDPKTVVLTKKVDTASRRHAETGGRSGAVDRELQGHHRGQRPDHPARRHQHHQGGERRVGGVGNRQDADGRHGGHDDAREGHAHR